MDLAVSTILDTAEQMTVCVASVHFVMLIPPAIEAATEAVAAVSIHTIVVSQMCPYMDMVPPCIYESVMAVDTVHQTVMCRQMLLAWV